uniref:Uncharacterized protein n=1 Tax=Salvator merianae TaxID=96440 RepID=A0A8D0BX50_SALMN
MIKLYHNDVTTKEQDLSEDPHLLKIPSVVLDDSDITPYQFDRHAPGRISTSPTLRRLRNTTSTISQVFPLQNGTESTRLHNQVSQSGLSLPLCPSSPPQPQHQLSSSYPELCRNPLSLQENSSQIDFLSVPPHREANFIHSQMVQKAKECKPYFQFEEKENSQDCVQVRNIATKRKGGLFFFPWFVRLGLLLKVN